MQCSSWKTVNSTSGRKMSRFPVVPSCSTHVRGFSRNTIDVKCFDLNVRNCKWWHWNFGCSHWQHFLHVTFSDPKWSDGKTCKQKQWNNSCRKTFQSIAFWWKLQRLPKFHFKVWTVELSNLKLSNITFIGRHLPSYNQRLPHKLELKTTYIHPTQWIHLGSLLRQLVWLSKSPRKNPMHDLSKNMLDLVLSFIHVY